jgi:hypothetical protein
MPDEYYHFDKNLENLKSRVAENFLKDDISAKKN